MESQNISQMSENERDSRHLRIRIKDLQPEFIQCRGAELNVRKEGCPRAVTVTDWNKLSARSSLHRPRVSAR